MTHMDITSRIASYLAAAPTMPLAPAVIEKASQHVLDTLAAMVSGSRLIPGEMAISYARKFCGAGPATVVGSDLRVDVVSAALANGMCAHADETDDSHVDSITHPGCAVVPAALALAEANGASGATFVRAVVAGYDICCRMVMAVETVQLRDSGHATHAFGGLFGAAAASGVVLRLDAACVPYLLSYAIQQACGIVCWRRDPDHIEKACDFAGFPARNGVQAATMVAHGMTGVPDALEGKQGFFEVFGRGFDPAQAWQDLGQRSIVMETGIKKWSVGSPAQSALDAVEAIRRVGPLNADDIEAITVTLPSASAKVVDNGPMPNVNCQHLVALSIVEGAPTFESSHDHARMSEPRIKALRERVSLVYDDALVKAKPPRQGIVEITLRNGRMLRHHARAVRGTADNPMSFEEVAAKARDLMAPVLGQGRTVEVIDAVKRIETLKNCGELASLLST
jgi:2-methylcitrate dehydratase PrpD